MTDPNTLADRRGGAGMSYAISLAAVRKYKPCADAIVRLEKILPKRGKIDAIQARKLGCTYEDVIFIAVAVAMDDEALARRLTHYLNDNAKRVLHIWEECWPDDLRPRKAIEACDAFLNGTGSEADWRRATRATRATRDAQSAWAARAAWAAGDAGAAWAAGAAWDAWAAWAAWAARAAWAAWAAGAAWAAWAAWDAGDARDSFRAWQFDRLIYWLAEADPVPLEMPALGKGPIYLASHKSLDGHANHG